MTIAIGVIGSATSRGDTLVLVADTKGTQGQDKSTDRLHKIFIGRGVYAAVAGENVSKAGELFARIDHKINALETRNSESIFAAIHSAMSEFHRIWATREVLSWYNYALDQLDKNIEDIDHKDRDEIEGNLRAYGLGFSLIIGAFDNEKRALLFRTYETPAVEEDSRMVFLDHVSVPGFAASGTGIDVAEFWLNYRNHTLSYSDERSAYHAYEAKRMCEKAEGVNERTNMLIATYYRYDWIHDGGPSSGDWSIEMFEKWFAELGPRSTNAIGAGREYH